MEIEPEDNNISTRKQSISIILSVFFLSKSFLNKTYFPVVLIVVTDLNKFNEKKNKKNK